MEGNNTFAYLQPSSSYTSSAHYFDMDSCRVPAAIDQQTTILEKLKKEQVTYPALLNIKSVGFHIL